MSKDEREATVQRNSPDRSPLCNLKERQSKNLLTTAPSGFRHQNLLLRIRSEDFSMRKGAFFALMSIFLATSEENTCKMLHLKYGCVAVSKQGGLT